MLHKGAQIPTTDEVQIAAVQFTLKWGNPHCQHVLVFWWQTLAQLRVISPLPHSAQRSFVRIPACKLKKKEKAAPILFSYLHTARQHGVKDVSSLFHDSHIPGGGVGALAVLDGVDKAVSELVQ